MAKLTTIEKIARVFPHPNADSIEFVQVLGYRCIVPKGKWKAGDWCVLIQPDSVLPDAEWSALYKAKSSRVRAIRLRGEYSFGIVEDVSILPPNGSHPEAGRFAEGQEVSGVLGVTKYEAPVPQDLNALRPIPHGILKTDEERFQNLDLAQYADRPVDITLKIDGQSLTAYYKDGETGVCGRTMEYRQDSDNPFTRNYKKYELAEKLRRYCETHGVNIALRGEQYGHGIQGHGLNPHSKLPGGVMFFSCWDIDNMRYFGPQDRHYYRRVCGELELPVVPLIEEAVPFSPALAEKYQALESINGQTFEGVVVCGQGFSFKIINLGYDSRK